MFVVTLTKIFFFFFTLVVRLADIEPYLKNIYHTFNIS